MAAAIHNFSIENGSDFRITFQYLDINSIPIDLTGYCASFLMKPTEGSGSAYGFSSKNSPLSLIVDGWTLLISGSNIILSLSSTKTLDITWTQGVYDLYITENSVPSRKSRIATGTITIVPNNFPTCKAECGNESECVDALNITPPEVTPETPITPTPTPVAAPETDLCERFCNNLELDAEVYIGGELVIPDNSATSGTISITNIRKLQNIELMINKLKHPYPQDLAMVLVPPTGNKILLSANDKIKNNNPTNGFSYIFSNKAAPNTYINNVINNNVNIPYVNIFDKTSIYNFNNETLSADISSWIGSYPSGNWTLLVKDHDIEGSGTIEDWRLIMTYEPLALTVDPLC